MKKQGFKDDFRLTAQFWACRFVIQDGNQCQDKCPAEHKGGIEGALKIKIRQRIAAAGRNSDETGHVLQKKRQDGSFYGYFLL